ncbi:MAG: hypothetical protein WBF84_17040 [Castellaniella sp.]|uniref:hypothetical protein n=1 Tax=Castellaniella sp. TaxID=1955812 RepID=UPI003C749400
MSEARARLEVLPNRYPHLFPKGSLTWGFEMGDGWSELIVALFAHIDAVLKDAPGARFEVVQVKEKFGSLRFYYHLAGVHDSVAEEVRKAVDLADEASSHICEYCGRPGALSSSGGWFSSRCEECRGRAF